MSVPKIGRTITEMWSGLRSLFDRLAIILGRAREDGYYTLSADGIDQKGLERVLEFLRGLDAYVAEFGDLDALLPDDMVSLSTHLGDRPYDYGTILRVRGGSDLLDRDELGLWIEQVEDILARGEVLKSHADILMTMTEAVYEMAVRGSSPPDRPDCTIHV